MTRVLDHWSNPFLSQAALTFVLFLTVLVSVLRSEESFSSAVCFCTSILISFVRVCLGAFIGPNRSLEMLESLISEEIGNKICIEYKRHFRFLEHINGF